MTDKFLEKKGNQKLLDHILDSVATMELAMGDEAPSSVTCNRTFYNMKIRWIEKQLNDLGITVIVHPDG